MHKTLFAVAALLSLFACNQDVAQPTEALTSSAQTPYFFAHDALLHAARANSTTAVLESSHWEPR